jgi:hypothetical protein
MIVVVAVLHSMQYHVRKGIWHQGTRAGDRQSSKHAPYFAWLITHVALNACAMSSCLIARVWHVAGTQGSMFQWVSMCSRRKYYG